MLKLGIILDPLEHLSLKTDSTLAIIEAAQRRQWPVYMMQAHDLFLQSDQCYATMRSLKIDLQQNPWYQAGDAELQPLSVLDIVLMRKDPPFDIDYIITTYLLELAEKAGTLVANRPQSLRDANEKLFTTAFSQCTPPTLVASQTAILRDFVQQQGRTVLKPLTGMGGHSVFCTDIDDPNLNVIIETLTLNGQQLAMAQQFIPAITEGDKRVLLVNGEPIPYALARIPHQNDFRGNLAAGAKGQVIPLGERERWICNQVGPTLREKGLWLAGLDIIGDYLTEINVTSPTCLREIDTALDTPVAEQLLDCLERAR